MSKIENVTLKVVGVTFKNDDGTSRRDIILNMNKTADVWLEREPDNQYDPNAIKVMTHDGQIGYIGKDYAAILAEKIDGGTEFCATLGEFGEHKSRPYVNIIINEV